MLHINCFGRVEEVWSPPVLPFFFFLRHGGPPPKALHQSGLTYTAGHSTVTTLHHTAPLHAQHCAPGNLTDPLSLFCLSHQLELFFSIFFRTIKARAQDLSRMKGLCTLVILRSATGLQTDFRQARLFQSVFLFAPALAHFSLLSPLVHFSMYHFLLFFLLPWYRLYIPLHRSPKWPPLVF